MELIEELAPGESVWVYFRIVGLDPGGLYIDSEGFNATLNAEFISLGIKRSRIGRLIDVFP